MSCLLFNKRGHIKEDRPKKNKNIRKKKELPTTESAMIEAGDKEDIMDGELLNWWNLNIDNFKDDNSDEE